MKQTRKDFLIYTFIVYLAVAIDFFPFEMRLNPLDWENSALVSFMVVFFVVLYFGGFCNKLFVKEKTDK